MPNCSGSLSQAFETTSISSSSALSPNRRVAVFAYVILLRGCLVGSIVPMVQGRSLYLRRTGEVIRLVWSVYRQRHFSRPQCPFRMRMVVVLVCLVVVWFRCGFSTVPICDHSFTICEKCDDEHIIYESSSYLCEVTRGYLKE